MRGYSVSVRAYTLTQTLSPRERGPAAAAASASRFLLPRFRWRLCRRLLRRRLLVLLQIALVIFDRGANQLLQFRRVDLVAFKIIDRTARIAAKTCVEQLVRIRKLGAISKGQ